MIQVNGAYLPLSPPMRWQQASTPAAQKIHGDTPGGNAKFRWNHKSNNRRDHREHKNHLDPQMTDKPAQK